MKICILNSRHAISDTRVKRIAETLSAAGNEVTIIAPSVREGEIILFEKELKISVIGLDSHPRGDFAKGRSVGGIFKTLLSRIDVSAALLRAGLKTKADVYHCNEMDSWVVGIILAVFQRCKVVFDVHEYYPARVTDVIANRTINRIAELFSRFFFNLLALFSDGFIFVNHSLVDLYGFRGKYAIVRNCVRKSDFMPLPVNQDLQDSYQDRIIVIHVGSLREQYGPRVLLDSLAYIKDPRVTLLIVGGAGKGFLTEVERRDLAEQVQVIEQLPFEEMLAYLAIADIGITPLQPIDKNTEYSLARKFLEYIAAGLPVIVSDLPEYHALVERYQLGMLIDPENPREIAEAIMKLVEDRRLRVQLGQNAAQAFEVELNWELESQKLFDLYDKLSKK